MHFFYCLDDKAPVTDTNIPSHLEHMLDILVEEEKEREFGETGLDFIYSCIYVWESLWLPVVCVSNKILAWLCHRVNCNSFMLPQHLQCKQVGIA